MDNLLTTAGFDESLYRDSSNPGIFGMGSVLNGTNDLTTSMGLKAGASSLVEPEVIY
jgi:hypothetical protein